jgi:DNA invertase Pin-like site-specific DNA recombinase
MGRLVLGSLDDFYKCQEAAERKHQYRCLAKTLKLAGMLWTEQVELCEPVDRLTREGTRTTLNYLQRLESKGVGYVSYQEQWLDSTGPFKDVMISMFATLAKQERARISERTIAGLKVARTKGKILGRPPLPEETVQKVLLLNRHAGIGARKIAKSTGYPLGSVNAILTRYRQQT